MTEKIRILIADDHPLVRQGLDVVLSAQPDMALVAAATNGDEAIRLARETKPDVIIMDSYANLGGPTAIKELIKSTGARILVLTSFPDDDNVFTAIKGDGFCSKTPPEQLSDAIRLFIRARVPYTQPSPELIKTQTSPALPPAPEPLTPRGRGAAMSGPGLIKP
jgi:DNA-binding NarL/FixJ family response regulator